jgi:hypothetical protein
MNSGRGSTAKAGLISSAAGLISHQIAARNKPPHGRLVCFRQAILTFQ